MPGGQVAWAFFTILALVFLVGVSVALNDRAKKALLYSWGWAFVWFLPSVLMQEYLGGMIALVLLAFITGLGLGTRGEDISTETLFKRMFPRKGPTK